MAAGVVAADPRPVPVTGLLQQAEDDLRWLAGQGALEGIAAIISERRRQIQDGDDTSGQYAAESAIDFGEWAKGGALCAAVLDGPAA